MSPRPHLSLLRRRPITADRAHDLPPLWDGHPVRWGPWKRTAPALLCDIDDADESEPVVSACERCGAIPEVDIVASGRVLSSITGPSGASRDGGLLACLTALRCDSCGHDTVHDIATGQTWDLDRHDYTDTGSWEEA